MLLGTQYVENSLLYSAVELGRQAISPWRSVIQAQDSLWTNAFNPLAYTALGRVMHASLEIAERITRDYPKPRFGITHVPVNGNDTAVTEHVVWERPFCRLLHFAKKSTPSPHPSLLIVAPMSGHYATLLRGTVTDLLPYYDVYITDWVNANQVPLSKGNFDLDDYIDHVIMALEHIGPHTHVMGVCQPTVPVLAATAIMSDMKNRSIPASLILLGGPVDARISPTAVNSFAEKRSMNWFETTMITRVPINYPGAMRGVFPGFVQLAGFMGMNMKRHIGEHVNLFNDLVKGDGDSAAAHREFYNEYLAVMDLPAEYYLQTIHTVFKEHTLPNGTMVSRDRRISLPAITRPHLLVLEGERDDISGIGQTKAAIPLCSGIPDSHKHYHLQKDVGHYGLFNGKRFRQEVVPRIRQFTGNVT